MSDRIILYIYDCLLINLVEKNNTNKLLVIGENFVRYWLEVSTII